MFAMFTMKQRSAMTIALVLLITGIAAGAQAATSASPKPSPTPSPTWPAVANSAPTIAIIDTSINSAQIPNIIHEACFTYSGDCPNGKSSMDGAGAANIPSFYWAAPNLNHGAMVVESAIAANPNVRIIFIRYADVMSYQGKPYMSGELSSEIAGLQWVAQNYKTYGIQAVSISTELRFAQGGCPTATYPQLTAAVETLKAGNVPVFAGVGNDGKQNYTAYPACSPDVIGVGATSSFGTPYYFSNLGQGVQLMAQGSTTVPMPTGPTGMATTPTRVSGTSIATPIAATLWASYYSGSWASQVAQMQLLPKMSDQFKNIYPWIK